jgi:hypothetical protein
MQLGKPMLFYVKQWDGCKKHLFSRVLSKDTSTGLSEGGIVFGVLQVVIKPQGEIDHLFRF